MWKKGLVLILLVMLTSGLSAQGMLTEHYQITTLDLAAGLPHNNVNHFFVDSKGFMWISTYGGGAVRYDGFSFMSPGIGTPRGWSSNSCKRITEDRYHRLWIAYDERTDVIDMRTMGKVIPSYKDGDISKMLDRLSVTVYSDTKGALWLVTRSSAIPSMRQVPSLISVITIIRETLLMSVSVTLSRTVPSGYV